MKYLGLLMTLFISANSYAATNVCGAVWGIDSNSQDESVSFSLLLTNVTGQNSNLKPNKVVRFGTQNKSEIAIVLKAFKLSNTEVCLYELSENGEEGTLESPIKFSSMSLR